MHQTPGKLVRICGKEFYIFLHGSWAKGWDGIGSFTPTYK